MTKQFERYNGKMHGIEPTLLNKTSAEQIDDYQMKIYELMKQVFPKATGYDAVCHEVTDANGEVVDVHTGFFMDGPIAKGRSANEI